MWVSLKTYTIKVAKPRNLLPCQERGGGRGDNAMMIMIKINEISNIWERNKTEASKRGGGGGVEK